MGLGGCPLGIRGLPPSFKPRQNHAVIRASPAVPGGQNDQLSECFESSNAGADGVM